MKFSGTDIRRIMDNPDVFFRIEMGNGAERKVHRGNSNVMIANYQSKGHSELGEKVPEFGFQFRSDSRGGMKKVAGNDEVSGLIVSGELYQPQEIVRRITLGDRQAVRAERCGFPEMDIRYNEG